MGMQRALALHPSPTGPRWLAFRRPEAVHRARSLDEVPSVLRAAEQAARRGRWVVLVVSYDAAPAMVARRHPSAPLAVAGVFAGAEAVAGPRPGRHRVGPWRPSWDEAAHAAAVQRARGHIAAGDVYQVNLTLRLRAAFEGDPESLFAALFRAQAPAYPAYVELAEGAVCSASPELLLSRRAGRLRTRPMKGTAARAAGATPGDDRAAVAALLASPKERAENTMIVDVARNDLGRVARVGSVVVDRLHDVEHYPTVHQLTSSVRADSDAGLVEVLGALLPAASITGAPKVRATQLIADLEDTARGVYCGTVGILGPDTWQLNVAIRTAWVDRDRGSVEYGVGGGIVWDSHPAGEWAEVAAKAAIVRGGPRRTSCWRRCGGSRAAACSAWAGTGGGCSTAAPSSASTWTPTGSTPPSHRSVPAGAPPTPVTRRRAGRPGSACWSTPADRAGPRWPRHRSWAPRSARPGRGAPSWPSDRCEPMTCSAGTRPRTGSSTSRPGLGARATACDLRVDDVICWDDEGRLTETTVGNLVLELDGRLVTPAEAAGLLPGTARAALVADGTVAEADLVPADVGRANRVWCVNAVRGWVLLDVVGGG